METKLNERRLLFISFNENQRCFLTAGPGGYRIFECETFKEKGAHNFKTGFIEQIESLYNFVALVGDGAHPLDSPNKVIIWDNIDKTAALSLQFDSPVRAVRLCHQCIVVVLENTVKVLTFSRPPRPVAEFKTITNTVGISALATRKTDCCILALPGLEIGQVQLINLSQEKQTTLQIQAHQTALSCLSMNLHGTRLATASERGTLIRIFDTKSGNMLAELRRGHSQALIYCMNFNHNSTMLVASSSHGTVHVFKLMENNNMQTSLSCYLPQYFSSQWSFVKMSLPQCKRSMCAFGPDESSVVVVCEDGHFYKFGFTPDGSTSLQLHRQFQHLTDYDFV